MPVKPPRGGSTPVEVDVHLQPNRISDADARHKPHPGHKGAEPLARDADPKRRSSLPDDNDPDAILPAPSVTVRSSPLDAETLPVISRPLQNYWIKSAAELPKADAEGFRLYRNRQYVVVSCLSQ